MEVHVSVGKLWAALERNSAIFCFEYAAVVSLWIEKIVSRAILSDFGFEHTSSFFCTRPCEFSFLPVA